MKDESIRLFDILWETKNAGPSPYDNRRTEVYFGGCKKALSGNQCKNCFNPLLWDGSRCYPKDPEEVVNAIEMNKVPKFVTIVGGEPTDQLPGLIKFGRILKEHNFHIMLFSWRSVEWFRKELDNDDINNFNIIVTDPYVEEERIYNVNRDDGIHNVIGSGNQRIWLPKENKIYYARDIRMMTLSKNKKLEVIKYNG